MAIISIRYGAKRASLPRGAMQSAALMLRRISPQTSTISADSVATDPGVDLERIRHPVAVELDREDIRAGSVHVRCPSSSK